MCSPLTLSQTFWKHRRHNLILYDPFHAFILFYDSVTFTLSEYLPRPVFYSCYVFTLVEKNSFFIVITSGINSHSIGFVIVTWMYLTKAYTLRVKYLIANSTNVFIFYNYLRIFCIKVYKHCNFKTCCTFLCSLPCINGIVYINHCPFLDQFI